MHEHKVTVYMADTDAAGVVYHANYLRFAEQARTELATELGIANHTLMAEHDCLFIIRSAELSYHKPAKCGDVLTIQSTPEKVSGVKLPFKQQIYCGEKLLTDVEVMLICVDKNLKPMRIPEFIKSRMGV